MWDSSFNLDRIMLYLVNDYEWHKSTILFKQIQIFRKGDTRKKCLPPRYTKQYYIRKVNKGNNNEYERNC